jgi:hypothetical protein
MFKKVVSIIAVLVFGASVASGQVAGDECANAITAVDGANAFDTTYATPSTQEPDESMCAGTYLNWNNSQDIWFKYIPTTTGSHTFTTCDPTSYDTSVVLYKNSCSNQIACNGDDPSGGGGGCQDYYSTIEFTLFSGTMYYFRIGGYNGGFGTGTLTIDPPPGGGDVTWYVDVDSATPGSGTDWASAFTDVQDALDIAISGDQIWIAEGTYRPSDTDGTSDSREASFRLIAGVEIYGGFQGNELDIDLRRPTDFRAIFSGDLNDDDDGGGDNSENSYHVVTADNLMGIPPILDGVYIGAGNANSGGNNKGGGLIVENYDAASTAYPIVRQTRFVFNDAYYGGGVSVADPYSGIQLTRCVLANNNAATAGGAIANLGRCTIDNCLIVANEATNRGGAVYSIGSYCTIIGSTIVQNSADFVGGLHFNSGTIQGSNNIFWGNTDVYGNNDQLYLVSGSWTGDHNCIQNLDSNIAGPNSIELHPRFVDEFGDDGEPSSGDENFRLLQQSPCIDAGDNAVVVVAVDIEGNDRFYDDPYTLPNGSVFVDMGAYEHIDGSHDVWIWNGASGTLFHNSLNWLPQGIPDFDANALFNTNQGTDRTVIFDQNADISKFVITEGNYTFKLEGKDLFLNAYSKGMQIDPYETGATASFKQGNIRSIHPLVLENGKLKCEEVWIDVPELSLNTGVDFSIGSGGGGVIGDVTNIGSRIYPAGTDTGLVELTGSLTHQSSGDDTGHLVGSLVFDIAGRYAGSTYDHIDITGATDMTCAVELLWDRFFAPVEGDTFDLLSVGLSFGDPSVIYSTGLPSDLAINWTSPTGLRGGDEVVVETTGPILFDAGNAVAISTESPYDIAVADLNSDNYPDVAMSVPSSLGGAGSVVVLINNGMSGDTWLGFTESAPIAVGIDPMDIEVGDFNGDGTANDLVVANNGSDSVSVLANDGSGVFTKTDVSTDVGPMYIAIADYTANDGLALDDIVVACSSFDASVLTNGSSLSPRSISFTHTGSINIPLAADINPSDVNNDKDIDFVLLDFASEEVRVLEGTGSGGTMPGFVFGNPLPSGSSPTELEFLDINNDGIEDAITVNEGDGSLSILLGDGSDLGNASSFVVGISPQSVVVQDFDNDGDDDMVVSVIGTVSGSRELTVIRNDSDVIVNLSAGDSFSSGSEPTIVEQGDFDNDGLNDVISIIDLNPLVGQNSPAINVSFNVTEVVVDCPEDVDGDGSVAVGDILALIAAWGSADEAADVNGDGIVDVSDLLALVGAWGPCS